MAPWQNTRSRTFACQTCAEPFEAKRQARYCSDQCRERARPRRNHDPEQVKAWRERRLSTPGYRERINQEANDRASRIRDWLDTYKLERGCFDCGYRAHPVALEFDHIGTGKALNVCNAKSIAQAEREIAKCEVVCANCHRIRTATRMNVRHRLDHKSS